MDTQEGIASWRCPEPAGVGLVRFCRVDEIDSQVGHAIQGNLRMNFVVSINGKGARAAEDVAYTLIVPSFPARPQAKRDE